ncbi:MAG: ATP-binding cassette domain-containing protein [Oscillospiraceae bacterium]|nr:ATP-binding cassette domain-containing protein [Oscillospiraceae bacterium]
MSENAELIMEARHITKKYPASNHRTLVANNDINLNLYRGRTLGIVGESGCGKSTFLRMVVCLEKPTEGEILYMGQDVTKLKGEKLRQHRRHIQMVFQDPSSAFSPRMRIRDIICEPLLNFGLIKHSERDEVARKYLEMVELPGDFAGRYPHNMSGGQRQRVGIARALALEPEIIICDEATSALDVSVQKNVIELLVRLQKEKDIAIGFVCHDMALVQSFAHQVAVMYLGNIVEIMPGGEVGTEAMHPYTKAMIGAIFDLDMDFSKPIESIDSEAPSPLDVPVGCPFQNRCDQCMERCLKERPVLREVAKDHLVACHLFSDAEPAVFSDAEEAGGDDHA